MLYSIGAVRSMKAHGPISFFRVFFGGACSIDDADTTEFVRGYLGEGHRDWVVSGVRLECARLAEKFRARPLEEQIKSSHPPHPRLRNLSNRASK